MPTTWDKAKVIEECTRLKNSWTKRDAKMKVWHSILQLKSSRSEENMEDVVNNDPRTAYNLALHLLTSSTISHTLSTDSMDAATVSAISAVKSKFEYQWKQINKQYRQRGKQSWIRYITGTMLDTGWFAVLAIPLPDKLIAEVWHPAETYPEFGDDGLVSVAHIYTLKPAAANRKVTINGWSHDPITTDIKLYDLYWYDESGVVNNAIVLGEQLVKTATPDSTLTRIPVFISPVSGLTDTGTLAICDAWQENFGESLVAVNEGVNKNYDDMLTFLQQILRDTATPRWFEQSVGDTVIMKPEDVFKRGTVFRGGPNDKLGPLETPGVPVELTTSLYNYQNMTQRGNFPYVLYGNLQQQLAGYAISQIASAAMQVLTPYHDAIKGLLTDIDNFWLEAIRSGRTSIEGFKLPKELPADLEFEVDYTVEIPGYLTQRATLARMLDPDFRLSNTWIMNKLFPEIADAAKEIARVNRDRALNQPVAVAVSTVLAYREQANMAAKAGDSKSASLFNMAADKLQAEISGKAPAQSTDKTAGMKVPRTVAPEEATQAVPPAGEESAEEVGGA